LRLFFIFFNFIANSVYRQVNNPQS
jgi:hypothetical protein